jgi:hypothetical protein
VWDEVGVSSAIKGCLPDSNVPLVVVEALVDPLLTISVAQKVEPIGAMSVESVIGLVLGSTLLGGVVGAYVQSARQREERFRERMIEAAISYLSEVPKARHALGEAVVVVRNEKSPDAAFTTARAAIDALRAMHPLLMVVFPDERVARAGGQLVLALESLLEHLRRCSPAEVTKDHLEPYWGEISRAHMMYAVVANHAIRQPAFRRNALARLRRRE